MLLATTVAVDTERDDKRIHYPQLARFSSKQRRVIYWRCASVFFATAYRVWPACRRLLFTNDDRPVFYERCNMRSFLTEELGVKIVPLEFKRLKPTGPRARVFRNNFYKLEVLEELARATKSIGVLADSDCIWLRPPTTAGFDPSQDALHLLDESHHSGMTEARLGERFREIAPSYRNRSARWFGGELIAGTAVNLRRLASDVQQAYELFRRRSTSGQTGILENDEWLLSFVAQDQHYAISEASHWFRRIWTGPNAGASAAETLNLSGLHLPAEKNLGFRAVFDDVLNPRSRFWRESLEGFPLYLGEYFGVPDRKKWPNYSTSERASQWASRTLRRMRVPINPHGRLARLVRKISSRI